MKTNNYTTIAVIVLVVGLGIGYMIGVSKTQPVAQKETMDMAGTMSSVSYELKGKTGDDFDRAFITQMIEHHQEAVEMAELALTNTNHQEIKNLAQAIIAAQTKEIGEMRSREKSWFGSN